VEYGRLKPWQDISETGVVYTLGDGTRMTIGAAGCILSIVHNLVLGLLKRVRFTNSAK